MPENSANGNVTAYVSETGEVVAQYAYDGFGRTLSATGPLAATFRHRFSTKHLDDETGFYYYGYRYYAPELMRWTTRDPIGEDGGLNLYSFCGNDGVNRVDALGLQSENAGDYIMNVSYKEVNKDVFYAERVRLGLDEDPDTYGYTYPKDESGNYYTALTSPPYKWEKLSERPRHNWKYRNWQLIKSGSGSYHLIVRIRSDKIDTIYKNKEKGTSTTIKNHELEHVRHHNLYLTKVSKCFKIMSKLKVCKNDTSRVDTYLSHMNGHYNEAMLKMSYLMDKTHYDPSINADAFSPDKQFTKAAEYAESHSEIFGTITCPEWKNYEQDMPVP